MTVVHSAAAQYRVIGVTYGTCHYRAIARLGLLVKVVLEPIPAVIGRKAGYTLDREDPGCPAGESNPGPPSCEATAPPTTPLCRRTYIESERICPAVDAEIKVWMGNPRNKAGGHDELLNSNTSKT
ncbi:hypothetical protein AOLI_G00201810 [Acnodon oligacanthus]